MNGTEIGYLTWQNTAAQLEQQQEQRAGRGLTLDERAQVETQAFNDLVSDVLLQQEYARRGITVSNAEIIEASRTSPPAEYQQAPELQTDGRFDMAKYQRVLGSPTAKQRGACSGIARVVLPHGNPKTETV